MLSHNAALRAPTIRVTSPLPLVHWNELFSSKLVSTGQIELGSVKGHQRPYIDLYLSVNIDVCSVLIVSSVLLLLCVITLIQPLSKTGDYTSNYFLFKFLLIQFNPSIKANASAV